MADPTMLPIGSQIVVNHTDIPLMTRLCRYGYTPIQPLSGNRMAMRRDFHKLLTQQELLDQVQRRPPHGAQPSMESNWSWLFIAAAIVIAVAGWSLST
jgi:hypothetical protein